MLKTLLRFLLNPCPLRSLAIRTIRKLHLGYYDERLKLGAVPRPHYGYCVYNAARLAHQLGYDKISILEFGVATGNGLVNLEYHAREVETLFQVKVEIYGFDTGKGLPTPVDYRDLPYHWKEGFFKMDVAKLEDKLKRARLVLGDVKETVSQFFAHFQPAPIGGIIFDLDFYSSTVDALRILEVKEEFCLPRIFCYLDDIIGTEVELYNDFTGVRLAIREFNQKQRNKKFSPAYHLLGQRIVEDWYHQIFICHDFDHSRYNDFVSAENQRIPMMQEVCSGSRRA